MRTGIPNRAQATALLAELGARGLRLRPLPDGRIYVEPATRLDADTADAIKAMREPLRAILLSPAGKPCTRCARFLFSAPTVCYWCRRAEGKPGHA